ncbi:patatin-like phospholipase family protein [Lachnoclostridium sp. An181]|uniref:patatin-like phospholipase family protein n=1 Tax=Lachnoclostridium sp. An181 TaxID=1965575 RepID=UPI000B386B38|nr:patatin family protein [Lachnoclostridium sp. An181]OUP49940.1 patatin family protein [Lachnoclostridium sp. An181]
MIKATMVLEGGAKRGVFTAGALDFLMDNDLYVSHVVGVSAGSCNAIDYVSRQPGRSKDCMIQREKEYSYIADFRTIVKERTLIDMEKLFHRFPMEDFPFDFETYFSSDAVCECVVTNCMTGKAEYLTEDKDKEKLMKICRASSSMPLVSPIVKIDGIPYLDGGLADSIPVKRAVEIGNKKIILILTRQKGYRKKPVSKAEANIYRRAYRRYPELVKSILRRPIVYNRTAQWIEKLEEEGKIFVLRPSMPTIGRMEKDYEKLLTFYEHGYDSMKEQADRLTKFLEI